MAKFDETVDFPTPPFPEETRMMCFIFGSCAFLGATTLDVMLMLTLMSLDTKCVIAFRQAFSRCSFIGQAGVVNSTLKLRVSSVISISV